MLNYINNDNDNNAVHYWPFHSAELATAILNRKSAPNKLIVDDSANDDSSMVAITEATLEKLQLFRGDVVLVRGKKRKESPFVLVTDDKLEDNKIKMNRVARNNLRVRLGDIISIHPCPDIRFGESVHVLPIDDTVSEVLLC